jgi:predicted ferric reductase
MSAVATPRRLSVRGLTAHSQRRRALVVRVVLAAGFIAVLVLWWVNTSAEFAATPAAVTTTIGELSGMLGGYLVCAQVLLIARIPWFEHAVGMDKLVLWHRTLGTAVLLLIVTHVGFMILGGMLFDHSTPWSEIGTILTGYPDMLTALIGTILFFAVGLGSARLLRNRLSYEAWYWLHLTAYVAIFLTFFHQISAGAHFVTNPINRVVWILLYLGTASAILTWRVILPLVVAWRQRLRVDRVVVENSGTTSVWFSGRRLDELGIRAGNFMIFRFIAWGHLLTAHPYSISRTPRSGVLRITVGALGDHSRRVRELRPGTLVFAEGPFGHFTADRASRTRLLLIAGGAGIGPICALAEELSARGCDVVLLYRAHSVAHLALLPELALLPGVKVLPVLGRRLDLGHDPLSASAVAALVPDAKEREVFICGPAGLAVRMEAVLGSLRVPARFIHREELSLS